MEHHDEWQRQYLEGALTQAQSQAYLASLPEAEQRELASLRNLMRELEALPPVPVPPGMLANIEAAIAAQPLYVAAAATPLAKASMQPSTWQRLTTWLKAPPTWGWSAAGFSAALVLMLLGGPLMHRHASQLPAGAVARAPLAQPKQMAMASAANGELATFRLHAPQAKSVAVIGEFNSWGARPAVTLQRQGNGQWQARVPLPPGQYQYAFLVDGRQVVADPQAVAYVQDDYGHRNAVLTLM